MNLDRLRQTWGPDETTAQERGWAWAVSLMCGVGLAVEWIGVYDLYVFNDHRWTVRVTVGPVIAEFTRLNRRKYEW